jgi:hypothetical protein
MKLITGEVVLFIYENLFTFYDVLILFANTSPNSALLHICIKYWLSFCKRKEMLEKSAKDLSEIVGVIIQIHCIE